MMFDFIRCSVISRRHAIRDCAAARRGPMMKARICASAKAIAA